MGIFSLPDGYSEIKKVNLQKDKRVAIIINMGAIGIMAALFILGIVVTPLYFGNKLSFFVVLLGAAVYMVAHELIHGILIKKYSGKKAKYKFTGLYILTGSKAYFNKREYRVIAVAPVILFGIVLLLFNIILPKEWFWRVYFIQIANLSVSFGDIYISSLISRFHSNVLIKGEGVTVTIYSQTK